jgi:hypothetical protein
MSVRFAGIWLLAVAFGLLACTRSTHKKSQASRASSQASHSELPATDFVVPTEAASASEVASASESASESPSESDSASASASESEAPVASSSASCGLRSLPKCPLQEFMANHVRAAYGAGDAKALASALTVVAANGPPDFPRWNEFARSGVQQSGDKQLVKASCKSCHGAYEKMYQNKYRDRKLTIDER